MASIWRGNAEAVMFGAKSERNRAGSLPCLTACTRPSGPQGPPPFGRYATSLPGTSANAVAFRTVFLWHFTHSSRQPPEASAALHLATHLGCCLQGGLLGKWIQPDLYGLLRYSFFTASASSAARSCNTSLLPRFSINPLLARALISRETASLCVLIFAANSKCVGAGLIDACPLTGPISSARRSSSRIRRLRTTRVLNSNTLSVMRRN